MFAFNTDLATHAILFDSNLPKALLGYPAIPRPVFFGSAATIGCVAFPKPISVMLDMGIHCSGIGLLPSYHTNLTTISRPNSSAILSLGSWRFHHQLTMSLCRYRCLVGLMGSILFHKGRYLAWIRLRS